MELSRFGAAGSGRLSLPHTPDGDSPPTVPRGPNHVTGRPELQLAGTRRTRRNSPRPATTQRPVLATGLIAYHHLARTRNVLRRDH
jgi:hypothetical protein